AAYDPGSNTAARAVLGGLWDQAPSVSAGSIATVIEADLHRSPQALFASWDASPLAAASLGQVHAARLHDGTEVVVKVQYPGVATRSRPAQCRSEPRQLSDRRRRRWPRPRVVPRLRVRVRAASERDGVRSRAVVGPARRRSRLRRRAVSHGARALGPAPEDRL